MITVSATIINIFKASIEYMKLLAVCLIICCSLFCCKHAPGRLYPDSPAQVVKDSAPIYRYKELAEDLGIDEMKRSQIKDLFGDWKITAIAKVGGSGQDEKTIFSNIGQKVHFDSSVFIGGTQKLLKPRYSLERINLNDLASLRVTTYFEGYKLCRKAVIMLHIDSAENFEVVNYTEMAVYADGRFYFYTKI